MFKIQFRVQNYTEKPVCCEIIDTNNSSITLWNIEENKFVLGANTIFPKVYSKYKMIFSHNMFPINYSGKIFDGYNIFTSFQNGMLHWCYYFFHENLSIKKYHMSKLNILISFYDKLNVQSVHNFSSKREFYFTKSGQIDYFQNLSSNSIFSFTKSGKLEYFSNYLKKMEFDFYLNGKIKIYTNPKYEKFKFN
jgi:hypothetical protein